MYKIFELFGKCTLLLFWKTTIAVVQAVFIHFGEKTASSALSQLR